MCSVERPRARAMGSAADIHRIYTGLEALIDATLAERENPKGDRIATGFPVPVPCPCFPS